MKIDWRVLILCFAIVFGVAYLGSVITSFNVGSDWYRSIKPSITPPSFVFPIVWNILFFLIALAWYFLWIKSKGEERGLVALAFGTNLFLNLLWSYLFFGNRFVGFAFFDLILLWISIWIIIYISYKIDKRISWMNVPYLLWVLFAGVLNYMIAF